MAFRYALADHGRTLATRPLGAQLRSDVVKKAAEDRAVVLDFNGIRSASHSFADEFVARLAEEVAIGDLDFDLAICDTSPEVERVVQKALERRQVELPQPA